MRHAVTTELQSLKFAIPLAALVFLFGSPSFSQSRGGSAGHAGGTLSHASTPTHVAPIRPGARVGTPLNPNFAPIGTVPGLSFNIQALAEADRRNARRGPRNQSVSPFLWYSPYTRYFDDYDQPQPPYDSSYAPPQPVYPPPAQQAEAVRAPAEPTEPQPPPRDVGQFVLVRLDGQTVFASAFMAVNGRVTYVTREGIRRSFPISELDKDATRQINEDNGTSISLPN